jgi:hypothetical protein
MTTTVTLPAPSLLTRARRSLDERRENTREEIPDHRSTTAIDLKGLTQLVLETTRDHASPRDRLVRLSLTTPRGFGPVGPAGAAYVEQMQESGEAVMLLVDRRVDESEHLYGIALTPRTNAELVERWVEGTGAARRCQMSGGVRGWATMQRTGESGLVRENLEAVLGYSAKSWPEGERTEADVYSAGVLRPLSRLVLEVPTVRLVVPTAAELLAGLRAGSGGLRADPGPADAPVTLLRACGACGASLDGRRVNCQHCDGACRVRAFRARQAERAAS